MQFMQQIKAYEDHSPVVKAAKMRYNTTISWGQIVGAVL